MTGFEIFLAIAGGVYWILLTLVLIVNASLQNQLNELNSDYDALDSDYDELDAQYDELESDYNELAASHETLAAKCSELDTECNDLASKLMEAADVLTVGAKIIKRQDNLIKLHTAAAVDAVHTIDRLEAECDKLSRELEKAKEERDVWQDICEGVKPDAILLADIKTLINQHECWFYDADQADKDEGDESIDCKLPDEGPPPDDCGYDYTPELTAPASTFVYFGRCSE